MNIVFFGATELGCKCCRLIIENKLANVSGIFTIPREFNISYSDKPVKNVNFADFHELGKEFGIPVTDVSGNLGSFTEKIKKLAPELIIVIGWYYLIPNDIRHIASKGCVGMHASLLPKYRGGAPLVWAMINGEEKTGLTFFYLSAGVDDGDIIAQHEITINQSDTIKDLLEKVTDSALAIAKEYVPLLAQGKAPRIKQDESKATNVPQRKPEDGEIDWSWDAKRIKDFIRAQTKPYPGAFTTINGKKIIIWDADII